MAKPCVLPWIHVQLQQDGQVLPCCRTDESFAYGNLRTASMQEIWNAEPIRGLRRSMLAGERLSMCGDCDRMEEAGEESTRETMRARYPDGEERFALTEANGTLPEASLLDITLRFSNTCNLRCRVCGPSNSTAWRGDAIALGRYVNPSPEPEKPLGDFDRFIKVIEPMLSTVRSIYFAGGEPLLERDHYLFLEYLIANKKTAVQLVYNTNFTQLGFGQWSVIELWRHFDSVVVGASFDGHGAFSELIRKGSVWQKIERNFLILRLLSNVKFHVYCTVSVLNCFHLPEAIDRWLALRMIHAPGMLQLNMVRSPDHYSLDILIEEERAMLRSKYATYLESLRQRVSDELYGDLSSRLNGILASLPAHANERARSVFRTESLALDRLRGESLTAHIPELKSLLE